MLRLSLRGRGGTRSFVDPQPLRRHLHSVKTLTIEKFLHSPVLAQKLQPGQSLLITANGKPELIVTKTRTRPRKSAAELRSQARALLTKPGEKVDTVTFLRDLRK